MRRERERKRSQTEGRRRSEGRGIKELLGESGAGTLMRPRRDPGDPGTPGGSPHRPCQISPAGNRRRGRGRGGVSEDNRGRESSSSSSSSSCRAEKLITSLLTNRRPESEAEAQLETSPQSRHTSRRNPSRETGDRPASLRQQTHRWILQGRRREREEEAQERVYLAAAR